MVPTFFNVLLSPCAAALGNARGGDLPLTGEDGGDGEPNNESLSLISEMWMGELEG